MNAPDPIRTSFTHAKKYDARGWKLVAIPAGSKAPKGAGWHKNPSPPEFWKDHPTHNMGVIHSLSGTCALDVDHLEHARLIFQTLGVDLDAMVDSGLRLNGNPDRRKAIFRVPDGVTLSPKKLSWPRESDPRKQDAIFELRGGGGQDVLPPSMHPDGYPYTWENPDFDEAPELPAELLDIWNRWNDLRPDMVALCPWVAKTPSKPPTSSPAAAQRVFSDGESVIDQYKAAVPIDLALVGAGFMQHGDRYLSPNSSTKEPGVIVDREKNQAFSFHASDDHINGEHRFDSFNLLTIEHNGDASAAAEEAAEWLGLAGKKEASVADLMATRHGGQVWRVWTQGESWEEVRVGGPSILNGSVFHDHNRTSEFFVATDFADEDVPPREWLVEGMVPMFTVSSLYGDGGTGKSLAALQLAASVALGQNWFGESVREGNALFVSAEDDRDELHRRLRDVSMAFSVGLADLKNLHMRSLAGEDALLALLQKDGSHVPTALFEELDRYVEDVQPTLIVLDTLADLFPGNENDRTQARQFIGLLRGLAIRHRCAVLLLAHPSLTGMASGSGSGGNTAWNNSVRSRLYLDRVTVRGENNQLIEDNPDLRILTNKKSNYGRTGKEIPLTWEHGIFVKTGEASRFDEAAESSKSNRVFMKLLRLLLEQGRMVNDKTASSYAPKVFAEHPDSEGVSKRAFKRAMETLLRDGLIQVEETGPASKRRTRFTITGG